MKKTKVIIAGSSGHLKVIIDIFEKSDNFNIIGIVDPIKRIGERIFGYPILGKDEDLPSIVDLYNCKNFFIAIGDNALRFNVYKKLKKIVEDCEFVNAIHPSTQIGKNVIIGKGVAVMANAVINPDSEISDFVIINTNSCVEHDSYISEFVTIAPGAVIGGNVTIGKYSAVSIGATILHGKKIGKNTIIGAGAVVTKNFEDNYVVYGVPAIEIRKRKFGEKYL